jgi:hypothetical protein
VRVDVVVVDHDGTHFPAGRCRIADVDEVVEQFCRWGLAPADVDGNIYGRSDLSGTFGVQDGRTVFYVDCRGAV